MFNIHSSIGAIISPSSTNESRLGEVQRLLVVIILIDCACIDFVMVESTSRFNLDAACSHQSLNSASSFK